MSVRKPVFLARESYRLRRVMDLARLLPVFGLFFYLLPLLWGGGDTGGAVVFIFGIWVVLVGGAALLAHRLASVTTSGSGGAHTGEEGRDGSV